MTDTLEIAEKHGAKQHFEENYEIVDGEYVATSGCNFITFTEAELEAFRTEIERRMVPEGWQVVPKVPTREMTAAMRHELPDMQDTIGALILVKYQYSAALAAIYLPMPRDMHLPAPAEQYHERR